MANLSIAFFEQIIDGDSPLWERARQKTETQTQCLAAIVILLAKIVDELKTANELPSSKIWPSQAPPF